MKLSLIIPIYNEEESVDILYNEIKEALKGLALDYEIIAVNDGSRDKSIDVLKRIAQSDIDFKVISFRRNYGQTAAISAGIDFSQGEIIIPLDADLQNDPADIKKLISKLNEGFDVVSGWRKNRQDTFDRRLPSQIANWLISRITGVNLHDYGCTLKAYRKEIIKGIRFYGEMHRFMPAYVVWQGGKVAEIEVNHRERKYGKAKYGLTRTFRVILDLMTVKFLMAYLTKPMHFFGRMGLILLLFGFLSGIGSLIAKFIYGISFILTPLPLLTVFLTIIGFQFILMGLLAEILIRIYYESGGKTAYNIKEKINL
ncbi:MAG: glycosyltransferase family 2 protein [Candidatus Parcubacteria bacterium]|nr:glycosyltransferase family 2 protein [Candidatus Parcubacteria bacterium]